MKKGGEQTPIKKLVKTILEEFKPKNRKNKKNKKQKQNKRKGGGLSQHHLEEKHLHEESEGAGEFESLQDVLDSVHDDRALRDLIEDKLLAEDFVSRILPSKTEDEVVCCSRKMEKLESGMSRLAQMQFAKEERSLFDYLREEREKETDLRKILHEVSASLRDLATVTNALDDSASSALHLSPASTELTSGRYDRLANQRETADDGRDRDMNENNVACALLHVSQYSEEKVPGPPLGLRGTRATADFLFQQYVHALQRSEYPLARRYMSLAALINDTEEEEEEEEKEKEKEEEGEEEGGCFFHCYVDHALLKLKGDTDRVILRIGTKKDQTASTSTAIRSVFFMIDQCLELLDLQLEEGQSKRQSKVVCFVGEIVECLAKQLIPLFSVTTAVTETEEEEEEEEKQEEQLERRLHYLHLYKECDTLSQKHPGLHLWPFVEATLALFKGSPLQ